MKKKKFELKSFSLILFIGLLLLAGLFPFYERTVEGSKAAAAVSVLLNVATAENQYFIKHKTLSSSLTVRLSLGRLSDFLK